MTIEVNQLDSYLPEQIVDLERRILDGSTGHTFRAIDDKDFADIGIDMEEEVEGRDVLDAGSGEGGLAKTAYIKGIETKIWSLNPALRRAEVKRAEEEHTATALRRSIDRDLSDYEIAAAQNFHDSHLSTDFAHDLSFPDESFDLVVDYEAENRYMPPGYTALYRRTMIQLLRVLRPGGRIIIGDWSGRSIGYRDPITGEIGEKERILRELGVRYQVLFFRNDMSVPCGAIIFK